MSQMVTRSIVTGTNLFLFLFRLKWFGMNEIQQNTIPYSELCFCFLSGIRLGTALRKKNRETNSVTNSNLCQFVTVKNVTNWSHIQCYLYKPVSVTVWKSGSERLWFGRLFHFLWNKIKFSRSLVVTLWRAAVRLNLYVADARTFWKIFYQFFLFFNFFFYSFFSKFSLIMPRPFDSVTILLHNLHANWVESRLNLKFWWKKILARIRMALAECEWHAATPGLTPLRLPRAPKTHFPETKKADQKHCENWSCESGSEFHKTSPMCERSEWRKQLRDHSRFETNPSWFRYHFEPFLV